MDTREIWIEKGYEHFGLYGPDDLSIKKIADECGIARTSFNYYFSKKEEFCNELLEKHYDMVDQYIEAAVLHCKKYFDQHELLLMFPSGFKFHKQLFNNRHHDKYDQIYIKCNEKCARKFTLRLFIDYYKLPLSLEEADPIHEALLDTWYSRLNVNDLTLEKMVSLTEEIMEGILVLLANKRNGVLKSPASFVSNLNLTDLSKN